MTKLDNVNLWEILPSSIKDDEKIQALAKSLNAELQKLSKQTEKVLHLPNLDKLPHAVLDKLAWQFDVLFYEPSTMSLETKRQIISQSLLTWRKVGTPYAVKKMLNAFSKDSAIQEWFEYEGGKPYHFKLKLQRLQDLEDSGETILRLIDAVKNVRSWLDAFDFDLTRDEQPDEILHVGFADVAAGTEHFDINSNFQDSHKLKRIAYDVTSGNISYSQDFSNQKNLQKLRAGFIHIQHGQITYKTEIEVDDDLWYELFLNWIKSRWAAWKDAKIIYYEPDEPIDDDDPTEESFGGNFIKLYINFHNSDNSRLIVMPFPRDDLSGKDINAVNVDGIFTKRGYLSNKIYRAVLAQKDIHKLYF